jgi:hypothetical protein
VKRAFPAIHAIRAVENGLAGDEPARDTTPHMRRKIASNPRAVVRPPVA